MAFASVAMQSALAQDDLFELSLGELLNLEVTSVSKRSQTVSEAAAAVFVITAEDIHRSGMTTLPEILRMAPGLEVAQVDANKWAVSARGFQSRFANKLLVLMDGRTLYSPLFSGVFWDAQDTFIEDIERIEVIRGPGATLWGSNAVNGVINIITRSAQDTEGTLINAGGGNLENGYVSARYGKALGDIGHIRFYGKHFDRDGSRVAATDTRGGDAWEQTRLGFRTDLELASNSRLTLHGDAYRGESGETVVEYALQPPYFTNINSRQSISGYNLVSLWQHKLTAGDQLSVKAFIDNASRDWDIVDLERTTFDLDIDYGVSRFDRHEWIVGFNYRITRDRHRESARFKVDPLRRDEELFSAFLQDEWQLVEDRLSVVAGVKLELNDYTGLETQPNLRISWLPNEQSSVWGSVARAVRTPGRLDRDVEFLADLMPPSGPVGLPELSFVNGNRDFQPETLIAYEAGYKRKSSEYFSWDVAFFYNDYSDVRSFSVIDVQCAPAGFFPLCLADPGTQAIRLDTQWSNTGTVESFGVEWAGNWRLSPRWSLRGTYSYIDETASADHGDLPEVTGGDPRHNLSLRVAHQPSTNTEVDVWMRYVDAVQALRTDVDAYVTLDARLAWRLSNGAELSINGRNLLAETPVQFRSELDDVPEMAIQRSVHVQVSWAF